MPSPGSSSRHRRRGLLLWIVCVILSGILFVLPPTVRNGISSGLEWSLFLPVRAVLGWGERSLFVSRENVRLQKELTSDRTKIAELGEAGRENEALRRMLGMKARSESNIVAARVVGRSLDWPGEVLWVQVSGVARPGTAVVTPEGLLGRVARVAGERAQVETLWHSRIAVSVLDGRSREQGILRWDPARPGWLWIDSVPLQSDFRVGDPIVTSGLGEVFPKGIRVGHVVGSEEDPRTQLKRVRVEPGVRRGIASEVFLIEERPPEDDASDRFPEPDMTPSGMPPLPGGPVPQP